MHVYLQGLLITLALVLFIWYAATNKRYSSTSPLPPGPPGDPIIGHVRIVPSSRPELSYEKWGREFNSDVIYVNFMGQPVVVLNSAQAAIDLLDKRSNIYSDRPDFHFFEESGWSETLTFFSLGAKFRKHRKMIQNAFNPANCEPYQSRQEDLARALVSSLLEKPTEWNSLLVKFATSVILGAAYGFRITRDDDPYVKLANKVAWIFSHGGPPGATLVDIFPIIRRLPLWVTFIPDLKFARESYPVIRDFRDLPFAAVKKSMTDGNATVSFTQKMLEERQRADSDSDFATADVTEDEIKGAAATLYAAGADTTLSTLAIFVLSMVRNPEVQEKGRREIDTLIGRSRLPNLKDRPNLPYLNRIFFEVARWHPVVPLGVPHKVSKDDVYKNMFIPKGSLVMANAYAITHDDSVYADPDSFNPDRYLPVVEGGAGEPLPVGHFGFGRRVCPGQHLGSASVWIVIATMLATLRISKAKDAEGNEITPNPKMTTGLESHPEPFPCVIEARDERASGLIRART